MNPELCLVGDELGKNNIKGPCWPNFVYIGPEPGMKGSCISKKNLCKKKTSRSKGFACKSKIDCNKTESKNKTKTFNKIAYSKCITDAQKKIKKGKLNLCPRGYCTAKHTFEVYPSAYANGYATSVCKGMKPDALNLTKSDKDYLERLEYKKSNKKRDNLQRWYDEKWVNLCKKGNGPGGFDVCGSGKGIANRSEYPYCRAYYKLPGTKVVTVEELKKNLSEEEFQNLIDNMCSKKQSLEQGINGKPTRIKLPDWVYKKIKSKRNQNGGWTITNNKLIYGGSKIPIPEAVRIEAKLGNKLIKKGFKGGTSTGWKRGLQLANDRYIDLISLANMRTWFSRHGPDAKNGGTSYPGYCKWLDDGKPFKIGKNKYKGAVSWLIWGGNAAYKWLKTKKIKNLLESNFPNRKKSNNINNLSC